MTGLTRLHNHRDLPKGVTRRLKGYQQVGNSFVPFYELVQEDQGKSDDESGESDAVTKGITDRDGRDLEDSRERMAPTHSPYGKQIFGDTRRK